MCYNVKKMCRKSSPSGEGTGEGPLTYRGISVITPLPLGEGTGEGPLLALNAVCSVLLCFSVRNRTHPL